MSIGSFGPKHPTESRLFGFDFEAELGDGEDLSTATFTMTVVEGTDASPSAMLSGSGVVSGTEALQRVIGGTAGVLYELKCTVTTTSGNTLVTCAALRVEEC